MVNNLIQRQERYKMIIPKEVEKKIRLLLNEIRNIEWSGVLFYDVEGNFEDSSLKIICKDILPMDIGNSTYTEWDMNADVVSYIVDHPELVGSYHGLLHSHHVMTTNPSGTDLNTLKEEGSDVNHFVSLIVNNAGTYTAMITRKVNIKNDIYSVYNYKSFDDITVEGKYDYTECKEAIEYFYLDVEIEKTEDNNGELLNRISQLREVKNKPTLNPFQYSKQDYMPYKSSMETFKPVNKEPIQKNLFENTIVQKEDELTDWYLKQLLTCSVMVPMNNTMNIDTIVKNMESLIDKRFGNEKNYEDFIINIIDYILYDFEHKLTMELKDNVPVTYTAELLFEKLIELTPNKYIKILISNIETYM